MRRPDCKTLLKYGITVAVNLLLALAYICGKTPLSQLFQLSGADRAMILCDACFVPGALTLLSGLLMWVASEGALDGVTYLGSCLVKALLPGRHGSFERYGEFLERKHETRKKGGTGFLCIVGLAFVLIAFIFWARFYSLS